MAAEAKAMETQTGDYEVHHGKSDLTLILEKGVFFYVHREVVCGQSSVLREILMGMEVSISTSLSARKMEELMLDSLNLRRHPPSSANSPTDFSPPPPPPPSSGTTAPRKSERRNPEIYISTTTTGGSNNGSSNSSSDNDSVAVEAMIHFFYHGDYLPDNYGPADSSTGGFGKDVGGFDRDVEFHGAVLRIARKYGVGGLVVLAERLLGKAKGLLETARAGGVGGGGEGEMSGERGGVGKSIVGVGMGGGVDEIGMVGKNRGGGIRVV